MKQVLALIIILALFPIHMFSSQIQVSGVVSGTWEVDTVLVLDNIYISNNGILVINPGVLVLFNGHFVFDISGQLIALGNPTEPIIFSVSDTTGFSNLESNEGAWNGLRFDHVPPINDSTVFEYCNFSYGKAVGEDSTYWYGGAVCARKCNKIRFSNCRFEHNMAYKNGGAMYAKEANITVKGCHFENNDCGLSQLYGYGGGVCLEFADAVVMQNYFTQNSSTGVGGGLSFEYSNPQIECNTFYNNFSAIGGGFVGLRSDGNRTIVNNLVIGNNGYFFGGGIAILETSMLFANNTVVQNYAGAGGGLYFNANSLSVFKNCIIWGNADASGEGLQVYIWDLYSAPGFSYCDVEGGVELFGGSGGGAGFNGYYENCLEENPQFVNNGNSPYDLGWNSPCINTGTPDTNGLHLPDVDFAGNNRIVENVVDIGAYEFQNSTGQLLNEAKNEYFKAFPNPFSEGLTIEYWVEDKEEITIGLYDAVGRRVAEIVNKDNVTGQKTIYWSTIPEMKNNNPNEIYYLLFDKGNSSYTLKIIYYE
jgi:hypothetical protein